MTNLADIKTCGDTKQECTDTMCWDWNMKHRLSNRINWNSSKVTLVQNVWRCFHSWPRKTGSVWSTWQQPFTHGGRITVSTARCQLHVYTLWSLACCSHWVWTFCLTFFHTGINQCSQCAKSTKLEQEYTLFGLVWPPHRLPFTRGVINNGYVNIGLDKTNMYTDSIRHV